MCGILFLHRSSVTSHGRVCTPFKISRALHLLPHSQVHICRSEALKERDCCESHRVATRRHKAYQPSTSLWQNASSLAYNPEVRTLRAAMRYSQLTQFFIAGNSVSGPTPSKSSTHSAGAPWVRGNTSVPGLSAAAERAQPNITCAQGHWRQHLAFQW